MGVDTKENGDLGRLRRSGKRPSLDTHFFMTDFRNKLALTAFKRERHGLTWGVLYILCVSVRLDF